MEYQRKEPTLKVISKCYCFSRQNGRQAKHRYPDPNSCDQIKIRIVPISHYHITLMQPKIATIHNVEEHVSRASTMSHTKNHVFPRSKHTDSIRDLLIDQPTKHTPDISKSHCCNKF